MARLRPLLGFLALGLLLLAADRLTAPARERQPIAIGAAERAEAEAEARALLGRAPTPAEREALLEARIDDEILYREALARGLDREDRGVRRRLARNLAFLRAPEGEAELAPPPPEREEELYREAVALGMDRSDAVVRRKLVQRVRLEIEAEGRGPEPTEEELRAWLAAHPGRGAGPPRVAFRHLFFDPARRGARAEQDARDALTALASGGERAAVGDGCLVPADQALQSATFVERLLGPQLAAALFEAPPDVWTGPLRSSLGWHLVRITARAPAGPPHEPTARAEARAALRAAASAFALRRFLDERRAGEGDGVN